MDTNAPAYHKQKLILRSKRIRGQFEALERTLEEGRDCSEVLQIISAARGAVNSLMTELLEGHIRHHVVLDPKRKPNSEQTVAADEVIDRLRPTSDSEITISASH